MTLGGGVALKFAVNLDRTRELEERGVHAQGFRQYLIENGHALCIFVGQHRWVEACVLLLFKEFLLFVHYTGEPLFILQQAMSQVPVTFEVCFNQSKTPITIPVISVRSGQLCTDLVFGFHQNLQKSLGAS